MYVLTWTYGYVLIIIVIPQKTYFKHSHIYSFHSLQLTDIPDSDEGNITSNWLTPWGKKQNKTRGAHSQSYVFYSL